MAITRDRVGVLYAREGTVWIFKLVTGSLRYLTVMLTYCLLKELQPLICSFGFFNNLYTHTV